MEPINQDRVRLLDSTAYPNVSEGYAETFDRQKRLAGTFDVWVSSHAGHFGLHDKFEPGDSYDPERFVGIDEYLERIQQYEQIYQDKLKQGWNGRGVACQTNWAVKWPSRLCLKSLLRTRPASHASDARPNG